MSAMKMKVFIPEKAATRFEPYEEMLKRGVEEAEDDVMKLKYMAYNPPAWVPNNLTWHWAGRVMAIMARVSMHGRYDMNKGMSAWKVWDVLRTFLNDEQLAAVGIEELRANLITSLQDRLRFLMNRPPLKSLDSCKHQQWFWKKLGGSAFCKTCIEHEREAESEPLVSQN